MFTFGEKTFTLGEITFTFGEITVTFGEITKISGFLIFFFFGWGVLGLCGSGGPVGGSKISISREFYKPQIAD